MFVPLHSLYGIEERMAVSRSWENSSALDRRLYICAQGGGLVQGSFLVSTDCREAVKPVNL